ncbi:MAG: transposase [Deltaproteobacteria bacterium]|nr:transposase [Deltaproteobacteria bacterium]
MARKPRLHFPSALYHVISRGNQRQPIFLDTEDHKHFLARFQHYHQKFPFHLYAYVLMPNHFHCLIQVENVPLGKILQPLLLSYTYYFNHKYEKVGHLFQGRFKAILCDQEVYLLELIRYIHLNPIRAKMAQRVEDYPWSSHPVYLGLRHEPWVETPRVLAQFSSHLQTARNKLAEFIADGAGGDPPWNPPMMKGQPLLGDANFSEKVYQTTQERDPCYWDLDLEWIEKHVCRMLQIDAEALQTPYRTAKEAGARAIIAYLWKRLAGGTLTELSQRYDRKPATFTQAIERVEHWKREDPHFWQRVAALEKEITIHKRKRYLNT